VDIARSSVSCTPFRPLSLEADQDDFDSAACGLADAAPSLNVVFVVTFLNMKTMNFPDVRCLNL
jgi:hypothetical protein